MTNDTPLIARGRARTLVSLNACWIPDLWHLHVWLKHKGKLQSAQEVLACWHLCHDLKRHIEETIHNTHTEVAADDRHDTAADDE